MEVLEAIKKRRSIRRFRLETIPDETLRLILEAGRLGPSAGNRQPWRFIVVKNAERRRALAEATDNYLFIADAPVIIVTLGDPNASPRWFRQDPMIAIEHMVLAATALGYGSCWIGGFDEEEVKRFLGVPERLAVIALLPIGVPGESPPPRPRKALREIVYLKSMVNH